MATENIKNESTTLVNYRVDSIVKDSAEAVLAGMGISASAYVSMCLRKLAQDREIPFTLKVDPEFWTAEAAVSEVAKSVEDGRFRGALEAFAKIRAAFADEVVKAVDESDNPRYFKAFMAFIDESSPLKLYRSIATELDGGIEGDAHGRGDWAEMCKRAMASIEEIADGFCSEHGIDPLGDGRAAAVSELDSILASAVREYDAHRENLAMRFVSPKSDPDFMTEAAMLSDLAKRESEKDRQGEWERGIELGAQAEAAAEMLK